MIEDPKTGAPARGPWAYVLATIGVISLLVWGATGYCVVAGGSTCWIRISVEPSLVPTSQVATGPRAPAPVERAPTAGAPSAGSGPIAPLPTTGNLPTANPNYVALVIGNSDYKSPNKPLKNPRNDAIAIAEALRGLNYTLVGGGAQLDLTYEQMRRVLIEFKTRAAKAEVGLVYYAGHGIQIDNKEPIFLIPIDAKLLRKEELEIEAVGLTFVTATLPNGVLPGGQEQVGVVVLDACRTSNYPLDGVEADKRGTGQRGLKAVKAPKRSFIAFSATAGEPAFDGEGANSPYAQSLLKHMNGPDNPGIKTVFDRVDRDFEVINDQTPVKDDKLADREIPIAASQAAPPVWTKRRDCPECPQIVVVPKGKFLMGSSESIWSESRGGISNSHEMPQHEVAIAKDFAVSTHEITFKDWDACVAAGGCEHKPSDAGWGRGERPVINVGWSDAQEYVKWLSRRTHNKYRLLSEAEWEYLARAGSRTAFPWGPEASHEYANYGKDLDNRKDLSGPGLVQGRDIWINTSPVGSFPPNKFGLYDMHGNVSEWVEDCWNHGYKGAPTDGSAWLKGDCGRRVFRGGSWIDIPMHLRSAERGPGGIGGQHYDIGFRIARTL